MNKKKYLLILGASSARERYSNKVFRLALENGFQVVGVHPRGEAIAGHKVFTSLSAAEHFIATGETTMKEGERAAESENTETEVAATGELTMGVGMIDTVSVYVNKGIALKMVDELARLTPEPRRIILNPGADDPEVASALRNKGLNVVIACTLVLMRTGQY